MTIAAADLALCLTIAHGLNQAWASRPGPVPGLRFVAAGAQAIPFADARFDLVLMLKSLHHVPLPSHRTAAKGRRRRTF